MTRNNADFHGEPSHLSASEIVSKYQPNDLGNLDGDYIRETVPEHFERKYQEATKPRLGSSTGNGPVTEQPPLAELIKSNGYDQSKPVKLHRNGFIINGHHRVAVMLKHAPNELIPVKHVGEAGNYDD
jgi:hypothetical protein